MARAPRSQTSDVPKTVLRIKGERRDWHHLFKSDVKPMKKNVSFKKGQPRIEHLDHTHVFHTINSQMKPQEYSSTVGGHFHKISWRMTANGPEVYEIGPPLYFKYVRKGANQRRVMSPVEWQDDNQDKVIVDSHTHKFHYVHSEEIAEKNVRAVAVDHSAAEMAELGLEDLGA